MRAGRAGKSKARYPRDRAETRKEFVKNWQERLIGESGLSLKDCRRMLEIGPSTGCPQKMLSRERHRKEAKLV
jgi:hypothetical protein